MDTNYQDDKLTDIQLECLTQHAVRLAQIYTVCHCILETEWRHTGSLLPQDPICNLLEPFVNDPECPFTPWSSFDTDFINYLQSDEFGPSRKGQLELIYIRGARVLGLLHLNVPTLYPILMEVFDAYPQLLEYTNEEDFPATNPADFTAGFLIHQIQLIAYT